MLDWFIQVLCGMGVGLVAGALVFVAMEYIDERQAVAKASRSRPQSPSAADIFIDMRERKHDTMRRMREVAKDYHRIEGR